MSNYGQTGLPKTMYNGRFDEGMTVDIKLLEIQELTSEFELESVLKLKTMLQSADML